MAIDVGTDGGDRDGVTVMAHTYIHYGNVANDTGFINHIEIYTGGQSQDLKVGVFYVTEGTTYVCRNFVTLSVSGGAGTKLEFDAPGDFTAFGVTAGDLIGCYGAVEVQSDETGAYDARHIDATDATDGEAHNFEGYDASKELALYATGFVPAGGGGLTIFMDMKL